MKKRTKSLLAAFCTMALCGCLIAGSTYALFTDTAEVNIAVTSGKVDVEAKVKDGTLKTYSATTEKTDTTTEIKDIESSKLGDFAGTYYYDTTKDNGTFTNGGTAVLSTNEYNESQLTLTNMTPGDKVDFDIEITNNSNVAIQYRIDFQSADTVKDSGDNILMSALNFSVSRLPAYQDDAATRQFNGLSTYITEWTKWEVPSSDDKTSIVNAEIELPLDAGNINQGKDITIIFKVEAVQANASISSSSTKLASPKVIEASSIVGSQSGSVKANVTMPNGTLLNGEDVSLSISEIATNDVVIDSDANTAKDSMIKAITNNNNSSTTYNISLSGISGDNTEYVSVVLTGIENDVQNVYHSGSAMTKLDVGSEPISDKNDDNYNEYGYFIYNNSDKTLTIYTTSFSPFTVEYKYDGGLGTEISPYIISNVAQLTKASNDTDNIYIKLNKDMALSQTLTIGKSITLDLNGFVLENNIALASLIEVGNGVVLTVNDSSEAKNGLVINTSSNETVQHSVSVNQLPTICVDDGGIFTFNSGKISSAYIAVYVNGGTANILGGTITKIEEYTGKLYDKKDYIPDYSVYLKNGNVNIGSTKNVVIPTLSDYRLSCIYVVDGILNIYSGTFRSTSNALKLKGGTTNIYGGNIESSSNEVISGNATIINIFGGTLSGNEGIFAYNGTKINISGTDKDINITAKAGKYVGDNYYPSFGICLAKSDGIIASDVAPALNISGSHVSISGGDYGISANDGSEVTISGGTILGIKDGIYACNNSKITISGSNTQISGTTYNGIKLYSSTLTILGGTITGLTYQGIYAESSTITISGGTITGNYYGIVAKINSRVTASETDANNAPTQITGNTYSGVYIDVSSLEVSGGTITGNEYGIYAASGTLEITNSVIFGLYQGVYGNGTKSVEIHNSQITATNNCGVIVCSGTLTISDDEKIDRKTTITGNWGVAVQDSATLATISDATITGKGKDGIYAASGTITVSNATITGNNYSVNVSEGATVTLTDCTLTGDTYGAVTINNTTSTEDGQ